MGILGGAAIAGLFGVGSALIGSDSASTAGQDQIQAANTASQTELSMFDQTQANLSPWMGSGQNALAALMNGMGLSSGATGGGGTNLSASNSAEWNAYLQQYPDVAQGYAQGIANGSISRQEFPTADSYAAWHYQNYGQKEGRTLPQLQTSGTPTSGAGSSGFGSLTAPFTQAQFQASPGYQYQLQQGNQAIQNSAAARGGLVSGNALKALQANGVGLANQDWYNAQNNYQQQQQQKFNMLQTLSGSGQNAAANLGSLGSQVAGSIGANTIGAGNSAAAASVAQGQIWSNLLNNSSFLNGINSMFGSGGSSAGPFSGSGVFDGSFDGITG